MMGHRGQQSGSSELAAVAEWVQAHYTPVIVDRAVIYDLTAAPKNS